MAGVSNTKRCQLDEKSLKSVLSRKEYAAHNDRITSAVSTSMLTACFRLRPAWERFNNHESREVEKLCFLILFIITIQSALSIALLVVVHPWLRMKQSYHSISRTPSTGIVNYCAFINFLAAISLAFDSWCSWLLQHSSQTLCALFSSNLQTQ